MTKPKYLSQIIIAILFGTFSLWICYKEGGLIWSPLLVSIGCFPFVWEKHIAPKIKSNKIDIKPELPVGEKGIFSIEGRIDRGAFWFRTFLMVILTYAIYIVTDLLDGKIALLLTLVGYIFIFFFSIIQGVKRMHDINKSGLYIFLPLLNIVYALTEGDRGDNKYGKVS